MILEQETRVLRRGLFDVQNEVGLGRQEEAYHRALVLWLRDRGVDFRSKPPHPLLYRDEVAHTLVPDFVVWNQLTIELKAIPRKLRPSDHIQLFDYLKCRSDRVGLLVNMGLDRVHVERIVYEPPEYKMDEDWSAWKGSIGGEARATGTALRQTLKQLFAQHGTGYGEEVTDRLLCFALVFDGFKLTSQPVSEAIYQDTVVHKSALNCSILNDSIVLVHTALFDDNQFNISRGLSYMKSLSIPWGIAVNFGRKKLHVTALHQNL